MRAVVDADIHSLTLRPAGTSTPAGDPYGDDPLPGAPPTWEEIGSRWSP